MAENINKPSAGTIHKITVIVQNVKNSIIKLPKDPNAFTKERILEFLADGMFKRDAAIMSGIDQSTFYRWVNADASFARQVELKILEYKQKLIKIVTYASVKKPEIAVKILEKRWPGEWNPPQPIEIIDPNKQLATTLQFFLTAGKNTKADLFKDSDEPKSNKQLPQSSSE